MNLRTYLRTLLLLVSTFLLHGHVFAEHGDLTLSGDVHSNQTGSYVEVPFSVPSGVDRISVALSYTGKQDHSVLDLGVEDPERLRGWSGGNKDHFTIGVSDATPSYLPGPIVPGNWKLLLGVANIRPGNAVHYTAIISFLMIGAPRVDSFADAPLSTRAGWYRGDLHMHTGESDGSCTSQRGEAVPCPVFITVQAAVERGLDFIAITDHNTTAQYNEERELQPFYDKLLLIPGREMTTYRGHANVYGTTRSLDFRVEAPERPSAQSLFLRAQRLGALVSINHPVRNFGEACIGCGWKPAAGDDMRNVNAVEAVNGLNPQLNLLDIAYWQRQLDGGYRLTGIGGSDTHKPERKTVGSPTTVVYADELSTPAVLDGIRAGRVFVDLTGSHDRLLEMQATESRGRTVHMGDALAPPLGDKVTFGVHVVGCPGSSVRITMDGKTPPGLQPEHITIADQSVELPWMSDGARHWIRADVLSSAGQLQLLGNPIYLNWNSTDAAR
jgi:hypothetical protein